MPNETERDYVLGTNDDELQRLGLQQRVWRPTVLDCWQRAGIGAGSRVLDVGSGPGYAAVDLAEIVGARGAVVGVERSRKFLEAARELCETRGFVQARFQELDLMLNPLPAGVFDAAWCRWVACFVASPAMLVTKLADALKPGGVAIFHEYMDYSTWRLSPPSPALEEFVRQVMASWRANGGEPDIARELPALLAGAGFRIRSMTPRIFCTRPGEEWWQWPASFISVNLKRMLELGRVDAAWVAAVKAEFAAAESNPNSLLLTPLVLEIIAEKTAS